MSWVRASPCHLDTGFLSAQRAQALSRMRKLSWPESMEGGVADSGQSTTGEDRRREGEGWVLHLLPSTFNYSHITELYLIFLLILHHTLTFLLRRETV